MRDDDVPTRVDVRRLASLSHAPAAHDPQGGPVLHRAR